MPINVICPHCQQPLAVPRRKLGDSAACPRCRGTFQIAPERPEGPALATVTPTGSPSAAPLPPIPPPPPPPTRKGAAPAADPAATARQDPAAPPAKKVARFIAPELAEVAQQNPAASAPAPLAAPAPAPTQIQPPSVRKTARFITAEAAASAVQLGQDGQLPELSLLETEEAKPKEATARFNPLVLVGAICLSLCMTILLIFMDFDSSGGTEGQAAARRAIAEDYLGGDNPQEPYQILLREALQAYSRKDRATEQACYRQVLNLLHVEGRSRFKGITGTTAHDAELEKHLAILLGGK